MRNSFRIGPEVPLLRRIRRLLLSPKPKKLRIKRNHNQLHSLNLSKTSLNKKSKLLLLKISHQKPLNGVSKLKLKLQSQLKLGEAQSNWRKSLLLSGENSLMKLLRHLFGVRHLN
jgi:hypothetical protein